MKLSVIEVLAKELFIELKQQRTVKNIARFCKSVSIYDSIENREVIKNSIYSEIRKIIINSNNNNEAVEKILRECGNHE